MQNEGAVFAVSHQIADAYDQAHGWVIRLLVTVANIGFAVDVVETRRFQTSLATVVKFTRLQRVYSFEREFRVSSELSRYEREMMYRYFEMRTLKVILVVTTFPGLVVEP